MLEENSHAPPATATLEALCLFDNEGERRGLDRNRERRDA